MLQLRSLVGLTTGLYAILLVRTLLLSGLAALAARSGTTANGGTPRRATAHDIALSLGSAWVFALGGALLIAADGRGSPGCSAMARGPGGWAPSALPGAAAAGRLLLRPAPAAASPPPLPLAAPGHHHSRHPTAWTAFAFDPAEALLQAGFLVAVALLLPLPRGTYLALLLTMSLWAVLNHLDPARLPAAFRQPGLGRWLIGPAHHGRHHRRPGSNFGLYFTLWDRLCGTEDQG